MDCIAPQKNFYLHNLRNALPSGPSPVLLSKAKMDLSSDMSSQRPGREEAQGSYLGFLWTLPPRPGHPGTVTAAPIIRYL